MIERDDILMKANDSCPRQETHVSFTTKQASFPLAGGTFSLVALGSMDLWQSNFFDIKIQIVKGGFIYSIIDSLYLRCDHDSLFSFFTLKRIQLFRSPHIPSFVYLERKGKYHSK